MCEALAVQIDSSSLPWECKQFRETEHKIRVLAELDLMACIHGIIEYLVQRHLKCHLV